MGRVLRRHAEDLFEVIDLGVLEGFALNPADELPQAAQAHLELFEAKGHEEAGGEVGLHLQVLEALVGDGHVFPELVKVVLVVLQIVAQVLQRALGTARMPAALPRLALTLVFFHSARYPGLAPQELSRSY